MTVRDNYQVTQKNPPCEGWSDLRSGFKSDKILHLEYA